MPPSRPDNARLRHSDLACICSCLRIIQSTIVPLHIAPRGVIFRHIPKHLLDSHFTNEPPAHKLLDFLCWFGIVSRRARQ
jgi:hypothetical protein